MKKETFLAVFVLFLTGSALAQVQYYGINMILDEEGNTDVVLTITFSRPARHLELSFLGKLEDVDVNSIAGKPECYVTTGAVSRISCTLNLTEEKRSVEVSFKTRDFVRRIQDKFYLDCDLSIGKDVEKLFASVKLPHGYSLVGENVKNRLSYPENTEIRSDGRHHIITWKFEKFSYDKPLRLQILYEKTVPSETFHAIYLVLIVIAIGVSSVLIYLRYFKGREILLSVLDEYERKVLDVIMNYGTVTQKKVVNETNLSKAKVSRVVKSLEKRGLIKVERRGRTNKLKLSRKKIGIFR